MKARMKFRTQWDSEEDEKQGFVARNMMLDPLSGLPQESLTAQEPTKACDLNDIVRRCGVRDHDLPVAPPIDPKYYGDVSDMPDLRTCLDRVKDASDRFMELPAALRARFHNRPSLLYEFVNDPRNTDEAVEMGLLRRDPKAAPPVPPTSSSAPVIPVVPAP